MKRKVRILLCKYRKQINSYLSILATKSLYWKSKLFQLLHTTIHFFSNMNLGAIIKNLN